MPEKKAFFHFFQRFVAIPCEISGLEGELQRQLDSPRVIGGGNGSEVAGAIRGADSPLVRIASQLWMVPDIENLDSELEIGAARFVKNEVFEEREIPVVPPRSPYSVRRFIAPGSRSWQ